MRKAVAAKTVDEYFAGVDEPARSTLVKMRERIRSIAPAEITEGISYGMPMFRYKRMRLWFAAFSDHCSLSYSGRNAPLVTCGKLCSTCV